jgi:predicted unusual protein kinase regulating ubiquinone biosynthesis (AarF/ABC1/UbiB family)
MDTIAEHLSGWKGRVAVPQSVPGLVTQRCMVMTYMDGLPLMQLKDEVAHLPKWQRDKVGIAGGKYMAGSRKER